MFTLSNPPKSDKLHGLLTSSRGEGEPVYGLLLADASAVNMNLS